LPPRDYNDALNGIAAQRSFSMFVLFIIGLIIPPAVSLITGGTTHKNAEALSKLMTPATIAALIVAGVGLVLMLVWSTQNGWDLIQGAMFGWFAAFLWDKALKPVRPEGVPGETPSKLDEATKAKRRE
jgi:hypothetical protein